MHIQIIAFIIQWFYQVCIWIGINLKQNMINSQQDFEKSPQGDPDKARQSAVTPTIHKADRPSDERQLESRELQVMTEPCRPSMKAHAILHDADYAYQQQVPLQTPSKVNGTRQGSEATLHPVANEHDRQLAEQLEQVVQDFKDASEQDSEGGRTKKARSRHSATAFSGAVDQHSLQTNPLQNSVEQAAHAFSYERIQKPDQQPVDLSELQQFAGGGDVARRNSQLTMQTAQTQNNRFNTQPSLGAISAVETSVYRETEAAPADREAALPTEEDAAKIYVSLSDGEEVKEDSILAQHNPPQAAQAVQEQSAMVARSQQEGDASQDPLVFNVQAQTGSVTVIEASAGSNLGKQQFSVAENSTSTNKILSNEYGTSTPGPQHGRYRNQSSSDAAKDQKVNGGLSSSDNSHQNTRSAVDKGNLEQRCTDPSDGRPNVDSQQSSAVSQYFHQIEPEDDKISISKQVILETDEDYRVGGSEHQVNADLLHLEPAVKLDTSLLPPGKSTTEIASDLVQERSKESSDMQAPNSQTQLEYSRSMNQIEAEQPPLGGERDSECGEIRLSQGDSSSARRLSKYLEKTPQFHGSSPVILEQAEENLSTMEAHQQSTHPQQPNYESDTGAAAAQHPASDSRGQSTGRLARAPIPEELKVSERDECDVAVSQDDALAANGRRSLQPPQTLDSNHEYADDAYVIQPAVKILPGSDGYDPQAMCPSDSKETIYENDALGSIAANRSQRGHTSQVASSAELAGSARRVRENRPPRPVDDQERYKSNNSKDPTNESRNQGTDQLRTSSRFSRGHEKELDRLAERINNSVLLSQKSGERRSQEPHGIDEEEGDEDGTVLAEVVDQGVRDGTSSELPKAVLRANKLKKGRARQRRAEAHDGSSDRDEYAAHSRRDEHRRGSEFPELAEEAQSRRSTPSQSPPANRPRMPADFSPQRNAGEAKYPAAIRKKPAIEGPVLRTRHERPAGWNGQPKIAAKGRKRTQDKSKSDDVEITGESEARPNNRQPKAKSIPKKPAVANKRAKDPAHSPQDSTAGEDSRSKQPSALLPKKRIKPAAKPPVFRQHRALHDVQKSRDKQLNAAQRQPGKNATAAAYQSQGIPLTMNNAKHHEAMQAGGRAGSRGRGAGGVFNKFSKDLAGLDFNSSQVGASLVDSSMVSGLNRSFFENQSRSDAQYEQKTSIAGYPQPVTIETTSTIDFHESVSRPFAGISQQQISELPIDQLYQMMSKNWNKDKMMFDRKCTQVLIDTQQMAAQQPVIEDSQIKERQQRFNILKERLLQKGSLNSRRQSDLHKLVQPKAPAVDRSLTEDQERLNRKLTDIEKVFHKSQELSKGKSVKPLQFGNFQFIFNKPDPTNHAFLHQQSKQQQQDEFVIPSSPMSAAAAKTQLPQSYQSQNFFSRPMHQNILLAANPIQNGRMKSQILTPKIINNFPDTTSGEGGVIGGQFKSTTAPPLMPSNITPTHDIRNTYRQAGQSKSNGAFRQHRSVVNNNFLGVPQESQINPMVDSRDQVRNEYADPPKISGMRASTANNHKYRPPVLQDALNSSAGFGCTSGVDFGNVLSDQSRYKPQIGLSPASAGNNQQSLIQKLQYRSMRGNRIKDFLAQVQSQKISMAPTPQSVNQNTNMQPVVDLQLESQFSGSNSHQRFGPHAVNSQSSIQCAEDYGISSNPVLLANKLKNSYNLQSEDGSLNNLDSRNDGSKKYIAVSKTHHIIPVDKQGAGVQSNKDETGTSITIIDKGGDFKSDGQHQHTKSGVLNSFLAQQDKRIDFGLCKLYQKVRDGQSFELEAPSTAEGGCKILKVADLENLLGFIKGRRLQTLTKPFQLKTHQECFQTINCLMDEQGMGYRVERMRREESQIDIERVYTLVCRAHKLYRARIDLVSIFDSIIQLEDMLPKVKQQIISKLAGSTNNAATGDQIDASVKQELERKGAELKDCLSQLVVSIPALLKTYKFFNNSFVFNDKDYLKYLSKEANEVKGLLGVYNIRF